jgi:hypothetical protein
MGELAPRRSRQLSPAAGHRQGGGVSATLLIAVAVIIVLSGAAFSLLSSSLGSATTMSRGIANAEILRHAASAIAAASGSDVDGVMLAPPGSLLKAAMAGSELPAGGWEIPATLAVRRVDAYGTGIAYCAWNHGSSNTGAGYFNGQATATDALTAFAIISAGPDKLFQANCTHARTGTRAGDDVVLAVAQGGLAHTNNGGLAWVDPVDCFDAASPATDLAGAAAGCGTSSSRVDLIATAGLAPGAIVLARKSGLFYFWYAGTWSAMAAGSGGYSDDGFLANNFTSVNGAATSTSYQSNIVRVSGIGNAVLVTVGSGSFAVSADGVAWGAWQAGAGSISNGQYLKLRQTSSASASTTITTTVNVGATAKTWNLTTT